MVPASAKKGSAIDDQWLPPSSYDKKMMDAMMGNPENIYDVDDPAHAAHNFKAQNLVKKNTKLPLRESDTSEASSGSYDSVNEAYEEEAMDLIEEVMDLIDDIDEDDHVHWETITGYLRSIRDVLLRCCVNESADFIVEETFKVGNIKLLDGTQVRLSKEDAAALNIAVSGTKNRDSMLADVMRTNKHFKDFMGFANSLREDYGSTVDSLLEDLSEGELLEYTDTELTEAQIWQKIKTGAIVGSRVGSRLGAVAGGVAGGAYGASIGGAVGVGSSVREVMRKRKQKANEADPYLHIEDCNNDDKSIVGSAAPAMDSDPNDKKKDKQPKKEEDLQEISKELAGRYIEKSAKDAANIGIVIGSKAGKYPNRDKGDPDPDVKRLINRYKGINRAVKTLKGKDNE